MNTYNRHKQRQRTEGDRRRQSTEGDREGDKTERTECPTMAAKLTAYEIAPDRG